MYILMYIIYTNIEIYVEILFYIYRDLAQSRGILLLYK